MIRYLTRQCFLQSRLLPLGLTVIPFALLFGAIHLVVPLSPRAVLRPGDGVEFLKFSPDSSVFLTARDGTFKKVGPLQVWDVESGRERFAVAQGWKALETVHFSPDSRMLAAHEEAGDLKLWDARTGEELASVRPPTEFGNWVNFCFTPDGKFLAIKDYSPGWPEKDFIRFWNIRNKEDVGRIEGYFWTMQMAPDSHTFITYTRKDHAKVDRVIFWSLVAGKSPRRVKEIPVSADQICFTPDLAMMASANCSPDPNKRTEIAIWDMATGAKRFSFDYDEKDTHFQNLSFLADGKMLAASGGGGWQLDWHTQTTLWDVASTPVQIGSFTGPPELSSDGQWLALPDDNGAVLYRAATMLQHGNLTARDDVGPSIFGTYNNMKQYPSLSFSPDGRLIAVGGLYRFAPQLSWQRWLPSKMSSFLDDSSGSLVRLWETETAKECAAFVECRMAFFSPNGKTLVTMHHGGIMKLWDLPLHKPLAIVFGLTFIVWLPFVFIWRFIRAIARAGSFSK